MLRFEQTRVINDITNKVIGWIGLEDGVPCFDPNDTDFFNAAELRQIADKLDELNAELVKTVGEGN